MTPETLAETALPPVPLTVEGASVLHQMMRFRRPAWRTLTDESRAEILLEADELLGDRERFQDGRQTAVFSLLGHKGDLMFVHFRRSFEELDEAQRELARISLSDYLEPVHSYLSIIELGLYEFTSKVYGELAAKGVAAALRRVEGGNRSGSRPFRERPWRPGSGPKSRPPSTSVFTRWTASAANPSTGTPSR